MNQLNGVLSPEQQQQWTDLIGETYDFPYSAYAGPGSQPQPQSGSLGAGGGTANITVTPAPSDRPVVVPKRGGRAAGSANRGAGSGANSTR